MTDEVRKVQLHLKHGDNMLSLRADTVLELSSIIADAEKAEALGVFFNPGRAAGDAGSSPAVATPASAGTETPATAPESQVSPDEAQAAVTKHLGPGTEEPASDALIGVAASKTGKTVEELKGISKSEAQRLIKEGK